MDAPLKFYSLVLPGQSLAKTIPGNTVEVKQAPDNAKTIFVRNNRVLLIYEKTGVGWSEKHKNEMFFSVPDENTNYHWAVYGGGLLAVRKTTGLLLYKWSNTGLNELSKALRYHDRYGYNALANTILFGKLYPNDAYIGVVSRLDKRLEFRAIDTKVSRNHLKSLSKRVDTGEEWKNPENSISLVESYDRKTQVAIALRTLAELKLFRFNERYELTELTTLKKFPPLDTEYDRIMFAKFDDGSINDLLHFTTQGLTMYRLNESTREFEKVYYSTAFSKLRGWDERTIRTIATVDIDNDGRNEIICSGPKGLSLYRPTFTENGFDLINVFDETIQDRTVRYGHPELAVKLATGNAYEILLFTGDHLMSVQTKPFTPTSNAIPSVQPDEKKLDPVIPLVVPQKKYIVWLHDQLDLNSLVQPLNPHSGTMELSIPLIELPNSFGVSVRKMLQYKNIPFTSFFGRGWSLPLDYISVERKNSAFPQDHDYAILKNNNRIVLKRHPAWDNGGVLAFIIEGYKQAQVAYFVRQQRWELKLEDRKFVYGTWGSLSKMRQQSVCKTWPLCGNARAQMMDQTSRWYLVHEECEYGQAFANYHYGEFDAVKGDRLARIELSSGSTASLEYRQDRLASIKVNTSSYEQNVFFEYDQHSLVHIRQENRTLFRFEYKDQHMSKIVYPNRLETTLQYADRMIDRRRFEEIMPVDLSPTIYYGPDYTVILDKEYENDRMVISVRSLLGGTDGPKVSKEKLAFGQPGIKSHMVYALDNLVALVLIYGSWKEVAILQYADGNWVERKYFYALPLDAVIGAGKKFVVLCNLKFVQIITVDHGGKLTFTEAVKAPLVPKNFLLHIFVNGFVMFDTEVRIWILGEKDRWLQGSTKSVKDNNVFAEIEKVIKGFDVDAEFGTALRKGFLADALTVHQNAIVLRVPSLNGMTFELKLYLIIMNYDSSPRVVSTEVVHIPIADFQTYEYLMPTKDGDTFKLHYVQQNKKLVLAMKHMSGPLLDSLEDQRKKTYKEIDEKGGNKAQKEQYKKDVDEKIVEEKENIKRAVIRKVQFAMDLSQFGVLSNQHGIVTGNVQVSYDGTKWVRQPISADTMRMETVDQMLGDDFKLVKKGRGDTFKIYEKSNNNLVFDTRTNNPQELQIVAPRYVQVQPEQKPITMFFFKTREKMTLPANETMVRASNTISLVTVCSVNETAKFVIVRPVDSFLLKKANLFTRQTIRLDGNETRTSSYIYDVQDAHLTSEGAMFYRVKVSPGADTERYGWYEQATDRKTGETTMKSFASNGTDVTVREKPKRDEGTQRKDYEGVIWDRSKQLKIVDLGHLKLRDEVVSYYGFEPYEQNSYGVDKKWIFTESDVQSEHENHYLRLTKTSSLKASFALKEPRTIWIFSCWLRLAKTPKEDEQLSHVVTVVVNNQRDNKKQTLTGVKVQHIISNWSYVEMIVHATDTLEGSTFLIDISLNPSASHPIVDVDHVRFSPLDLNFRANIYTPLTAELRAILTNNGMLKQSLFSPIGKRVALLAEDGQVVEFAMHSKTAYVAALGARQCLVEMKPRRGVYETFDANQWKPGQPRDWSVSYGVLEYKNDRTGGEIVRTYALPFKTIALRFLYEFVSDGAKIAFKWDSHQFYIFCSGRFCQDPPKMGEVLIFITPRRVSVWLEGHLLSENLLPRTNPPSTGHQFRLLPTGSFKITEFLTMYDPRMKVSYHNQMGRPLQVIAYDDPQTVRVREIIYDAIDRPTMQTKWTKLVVAANVKSYFAYYENFITRVHEKSYKMEGLVADAHPSCDGFPYSHTVYANDPTENKQYQGLPGKDFSITGKYKRRYAMWPEVPVLANLFPESQGYRQKIVERPGGAVRATVEDKRGNKVAEYWHVGNYEHRLTTYDYSELYNTLSRVLPPRYHELAKTTTRTRPYLTGGDSGEEIRLKQQWQISYEYDDDRTIQKETPDGGGYEYIYSEAGILRFTLHYKSRMQQGLDRVIHFTYASNGKVIREALVKLTREQCFEMAQTDDMPESDNLIESFYGEVESNPAVRYRSQQSTRIIGNNRMMESLIFDEDDKLSKKIFIVPTINTTYAIEYEYANGNLHSLRYPIDSATSAFKLIYDYNGHGEVKSIRESTKRDPMFKFTYNADGMVETMKVQMDAKHTFQRNYTYNEPGFLVKLEDDYLTESVSYVETDSYGQDSYTPIYEGLISQTFFTAHWQKLTSSLRNSIYPEYFITNEMDRKRAVTCHNHLNRKGYLDEKNLVQKTFYGEGDDDLPFICGDRIPMNHLSEVLSSRSFPHVYGHRYDYDDHDQLIKAKYFHGKEELKLTPLTYRSFSKEIKGVNEDSSKSIWNTLYEKGYTSLDCTNPNLCHGREGTKSIFADFINQHQYSHHLKTVLSKAIAERKALDVNTFEAKCKNWIEGSNMIMKTCADLKDSLSKQNMIGSSPDNPQRSLNTTFTDVLKNFKGNVPDIVRVLTHHFATALGRSASDVQSYEIDANGNHRLFYTGFSRYRLEYRAGTNQITKLHRQYFDRDQRDEDHFEMEHNSDGAVVKAKHKGIKHMEYDQILHRVNKIEMDDGRKLLYQYDVRAERTFKQVLDKDGKVTSEKYYIRDANGLVLVDMDMTYLAKDQPPDVRVTSYIYKDQQLIGFVRNDKLYAVITDHEGSVRLVVKDGEVIAAYDYLPYGQIFRRFGKDLDGQISYLYTGQEWEPETGLYNYRARLYDPEIGRFYQMDPKEQYPSPYVYAGNSPVSLVDPDGEFAFAIACLIMALIGAYLGAASANNCWNPLEWDWRSTSTWLGLLTGAVTGASIPFNMASSVAFFVGMGLSLSTSIAIMVGTGITFAYFTMAATSGTWDPTQFDYSSPGTWNALMNGVATASWILMNPSSLISSFASITSVAGRALFFVGKLALSLGFTYLFAALSQGGEFDATKWDFSDPQLYMSIVDGFTTATVGVLFVRNIPGQLSKWTGKAKRTFDLFVGNLITFRAQLTLGSTWSNVAKHSSKFLYVSFRNMQTLQKGFLSVGFYSLVVSLRLSTIFDSPIPPYTAAESMINVLFTTEQFSDFIVKPLSPATPKLMLPRPPNIARLVSFRIRSEAIRLGNDTIVPSGPHHTSSASSLTGFLESFVKYPFDWFFGSEKIQPNATPDTAISCASPRKENVPGSVYPLKNCYKIRNDRYPDGMISCYGHSTTVTIVPKFDHAPKVEEIDHYNYCLPLTYEGHPSVSCDGEWSSLIYTSKESMRVFDMVDGWLLLTQVAPSAYREIKRGIKYVFSNPKRYKEQMDRDRSESHRMILRGKLDKLKSHPNLGEQRPWAQWALEDLIEDVEIYLADGRGSYTSFIERITTLEAEIHEDVVVQDLRRACTKQQESKELRRDIVKPNNEWTSVDMPGRGHIMQLMTGLSGFMFKGLR